jgi:hypothetical protein
MKRSMVVVIIALSLVSVGFLGFPLSASADVDVLVARIDRIGMYFPNETRGAMVQLTDMSSTPAWSGSRQFFLSQATFGNQGLATMLTAFSMGKTVYVRIAGTAEALSLITVIYVNAD